MSLLMKRASHLTVLALVMLAAAGLVLQAASLPHLHASGGSGLYNQEHDLTLLASLTAHVTLSDAAPALTLDQVAGALAPSVPESRVLRVAYAADSRAPPVR